MAKSVKTYEQLQADYERVFMRCDIARGNVAKEKANRALLKIENELAAHRARTAYEAGQPLSGLDALYL